MIRGNGQPADMGHSRAATGAATPAAPRGMCEIQLVADRSSGATHKFFQHWRFEAVMSLGQPDAGTTLFAIEPTPLEMAASGGHYALTWLAERPRPFGTGRTVFSWLTTNAPAAPDPLAAALDGVRIWLGAGGWQQDQVNATHYAKPILRAPTRPSPHG